MGTKLNIDWSEIKHPTTAQQDNMRAVRMQLGGSAAAELGANSGGLQLQPTQGTPTPQADFFAPYSYENFYGRSPSEMNDGLRAMMAMLGDHRFLEGDTEFSDSDIEDHYLRKAT